MSSVSRETFRTWFCIASILHNGNYCSAIERQRQELTGACVEGSTMQRRRRAPSLRRAKPPIFFLLAARKLDCSSARREHMFIGPLSGCEKNRGSDNSVGSCVDGDGDDGQVWLKVPVCCECRPIRVCKICRCDVCLGIVFDCGGKFVCFCDETRLATGIRAGSQHGRTDIRLSVQTDSDRRFDRRKVFHSEVFLRRQVSRVLRPDGRGRLLLPPGGGEEGCESETTALGHSGTGTLQVRKEGRKDG